MLLLEDDPAVRRFVEMALDTLKLELLPCATLADAYGVLERDPVQLVLTACAVKPRPSALARMAQRPSRRTCAGI